MLMGPDNPVVHDAFAIVPSAKFIFEIVSFPEFVTYKYAPLIAMLMGLDNPVAHDAIAVVPSAKFIFEIVSFPEFETYKYAPLIAMP